MAHPKDDEAYPEGTVVRIKKTGQFALIIKRHFQKDGRGFLHYLARVDGRGNGLYALYHDDIELENMPF